MIAPRISSSPPFLTSAALPPKFMSIDPRLRLIGACLLALGWCGLLVGIRSIWTWNSDYLFLPWNLGLAVMPILFSTALVSVSNRWLRLALALLWLVFLPNAPYLITDFIHLRALDSGPLWLDVLMLFSCAMTGLALGYCSVLQIHSLLHAARLPRLGWIISLGALVLSAFGIYVGRFLRWHSIDLLHSPHAVLADVLERIFMPWIHYRAWAFTLTLGTLLAVGYILLLGISSVITKSRVNP